jgi:excisionase family DNA binding protein
MIDKLLTVQELAQALRVPTSWVYARTRKKIENGMPCIRVGKYLRFRLDAVLDWLETEVCRDDDR